MSIPKNAKQVFRGIIFDVYHYPKKTKSGKKMILEKLDRADTVGVIAVRDNKIVLGRELEIMNNQFYYSLFGGRVDSGETPAKAVRRELLEESGLASNDWELYKVYEPSWRVNWKIHLFIARDCRKVADQKLEPGEQISPISVSFKKFIDIVSSEGKFRGKELTEDVLRMKLEPKKLKQFERKVFRR